MCLVVCVFRALCAFDVCVYGVFLVYICKRCVFYRVWCVFVTSVCVECVFFVCAICVYVLCMFLCVFCVRSCVCVE